MSLEDGRVGAAKMNHHLADVSIFCLGMNDPSAGQSCVNRSAMFVGNVTRLEEFRRQSK